MRPINCKACNSNEVIDDYGSGDVICLNCGLVACPLYICDIAASTIEYGFDNLTNSSSTHRQKIAEFFNYLLIQSNEIIENAVKIFHSVRKRMRTEKMNVSDKSKVIRILYAYSMYEACNLASCPRYLSEFCKVCEVSESKVLQLEKMLELKHTHCSTIEYVERTIDLLGLPYWMGDGVKCLIKHADSFDSYKSLNVISAIIVLICRQFPDWLAKNKEEINEKSLLHSILTRHKTCTTDFKSRKWNVTNVCIETGTNSGVIYKILRELQNIDLFKILNETPRNTSTN